MFDRFFSSNNVIWGAMSKIFDLFVLNCLLLICSVPILTIGPALTGFYYALINMARDEEISVTKEFFRSFAGNFRQAMKLGLLFTLIIGFLTLDVRMCRAAGTGIYSFFLFFFLVILLFAICCAIYTFPVLAKFDKSSKEILILAFTLSIRNFGSTLMILFFALLGAWVTHLLPGLLFIMFGLEGLLQASVMNRIFSPWLPAPEEPSDECRPLFSEDDEP